MHRQSNGLSLRETREKLNELAQMRAHVAYQQAKLKRQNKIKSRKYRRQLRKEKKKEMQQMDQEECSNEVSEMERITERATLKHSKSSKGLHFVAKHADKTYKNQVLATKDKIRKELLSKGKPGGDADEGSVSGEDSQCGNSDDEAAKIVSSSKDSDNPWNVNNEDQLLKLIKDNAEVRKTEQKEMEKNVDPNAFIQVNVKGPNFGAGDSIGNGNSSEEEDILAGARSKIHEAFAADDDIMRDFKKEAKEKQEARHKSKQKVFQTLPGWGSWVGNTKSGKTKAKNNRAKNRNRMLERQNGPKQGSTERRNKGYQIIINDGARGQTVRNHQATNLPFPFTGVSDFEASIRTPIGDTFVPRTSFKKQVQPNIQVAKGAVIEPMDKSELMNRGVHFSEEDKDQYEVNAV